MKKEKLKRGNEGITLIALVITIIVLLILAGVTIAMLTGENGILTQSSKATVTQVEANVDERVRLAVQGCKIAIANETAKDQSWSAVTDGIKPSDNKLDRASASGLTSEATNGVILASIAEDLKDTGYFISATTPTGEGTEATRDITVEYSGDDYKKATNNTNAKIEYTLNITQHEVKIAYRQIGSSESSQDGGDSQGGDDNLGNDTPATSAITYKDADGNEVAEEDVVVGNDVVIGTEKFKVIAKTATKITAIPYYNLVLSSNPIKQATVGENAGTVVFSSAQFWTGMGVDIEPMSSSNIQQYIEAYQTTLGLSNVTTRVARWSDVENLSKEQRNPGQSGYFYLGTSSAYVNGIVMVIIADGGGNSRNGYFDTDFGGVRPVIDISIL